MARAGPPGRGPVRRRPRRLDRQRRAALDRARPAVLPGEPLVGRQRLHARLRRLPAARRAHGRPPRPPPHVHRRPRPLRARLAGRRPGQDRGPADRRPRRPGPRRRAALAGRAVAGHHDVRRGRRAQPRAGRLGRRGRLRRRGRRAARRHAHRVRWAGSGCCSSTCRSASPRPRWRRACCPRAAARARARFDVAGAVTVTAGLSLLVYALVDANDAGWGSAQTLGLGARGARADRRLRGDRAALEGAARAVRHLPQADADRRERRRRCSWRRRCSRCSSSSRSTCSRCSATTR